MRRGDLSAVREIVLIFTSPPGHSLGIPPSSPASSLSSVWLGSLRAAWVGQILPQRCARAPMALEGRRKLHWGTSGQGKSGPWFCPSPETPGQPESVSSSFGFPQTALTFSTGHSRCTSTIRSYQSWVVSLLFVSFPRHPAWRKQPGCDSPCSHQGITVGPVLQPLLLSPFWVSACPQTQREAPGVCSAPRTSEAQEIQPNVSAGKSAPVSPCVFTSVSAASTGSWASLLPLNNASHHRDSPTTALHKPPPEQPARFRD